MTTRLAYSKKLFGGAQGKAGSDWSCSVRRGTLVSDTWEDPERGIRASILIDGNEEPSEFGTDWAMSAGRRVVLLFFGVQALVLPGANEAEGAVKETYITHMEHTTGDNVSSGQFDLSVLYWRDGWASVIYSLNVTMLRDMDTYDIGLPSLAALGVNPISRVAFPCVGIDEDAESVSFGLMTVETDGESRLLVKDAAAGTTYSATVTYNTYAT